MDGQQFLDVLRADMPTLVGAEDAMRRLVEASNKTGLPGTLVLTMKVHRPKNADEGRVYVTTTLAERAPKPAGRDRLFFVTDEGGLSRRDPRQNEIPGLAAVPEQPPETTDAPPQAGAETTEARPQSVRRTAAKG